MSIEIDWEKLTTGPDGLVLAENIRKFIHDKFQQVALPRFIRSVQVHSFEFGDQSPTVELKDICDPIPDFYEEDEEGSSEEEDSKDEIHTNAPRETLKERREVARQLPNLTTSFIPQLPRLQSSLGLVDHLASPILSRSSTPGIPGGTSSLGYFHMPLSARLQGTQTPLAAFGGTPYSTNHPSSLQHSRLQSIQSPTESRRFPSVSSPDEYNDPSTRPTTAHSAGNSVEQSFEDTNNQIPEPDPLDTQIVLHVSYNGNIRLSLTAEILLDYPMPSFVGIPLKLNVTGVSFDGVALLAYVKKRAHFCFLGQEDAEILVGAENSLENHTSNRDTKDKIGSLLREVRVETEIGQQENGKQVLKNVSKVERFVLDQVRRIFEDEFVYPSFWTFLV
jgi:mitochondrial distribution and morphology protein 12